MEYDHLRNSLNAGRVRRFHTAVEIPPQSVAEHSFGVALIVEYLHSKSVKPSGSDFSGRLMRHALKHDLSEYFTADIPSPVRKKFDDDEFNDMADEFAETKLGYIPPEKGSLVYDYVRMADKLEALRYFCQLWGEGNRVAQHYARLQLRSINEMGVGSPAQELAESFVAEAMEEVPSAPSAS